MNIVSINGESVNVFEIGFYHTAGLNLFIGRKNKFIKYFVFDNRKDLDDALASLDSALTGEIINFQGYRVVGRFVQNFDKINNSNGHFLRIELFTIKSLYIGLVSKELLDDAFDSLVIFLNELPGIPDIQAEVTALQTEVTALQTEVTALPTEVTALQTEIAPANCKFVSSSFAGLPSPFFTNIVDAYTEAMEGDTIIVNAGEYVEPLIQLRNNVSIHCLGSVHITGSDRLLFTDGGTELNFKLLGFPNITATNFLDVSGGSVVSCYLNEVNISGKLLNLDKGNVFFDIAKIISGAIDIKSGVCKMNTKELLQGSGSDDNIHTESTGVLYLTAENIESSIKCEGGSTLHLKTLTLLQKFSGNKFLTFFDSATIFIECNKIKTNSGANDIVWFYGSADVTIKAIVNDIQFSSITGSPIVKYISETIYSCFAIRGTANVTLEANKLLPFISYLISIEDTALLALNVRVCTAKIMILDSAQVRAYNTAFSQGVTGTENISIGNENTKVLLFNCTLVALNPSVLYTVSGESQMATGLYLYNCIGNKVTEATAFVNIYTVNANIIA